MQVIHVAVHAFARTAQSKMFIFLLLCCYLVTCEMSCTMAFHAYP